MFGPGKRAQPPCLYEQRPEFFPVAVVIREDVVGLSYDDFVDEHQGIVPRIVVPYGANVHAVDFQFDIPGLSGFEIKGIQFRSEEGILGDGMGDGLSGLREMLAVDRGEGFDAFGQEGRLPENLQMMGIDVPDGFHFFEVDGQFHRGLVEAQPLGDPDLRAVQTVGQQG